MRCKVLKSNDRKIEDAVHQIRKSQIQNECSWCRCFLQIEPKKLQMVLTYLAHNIITKADENISSLTYFLKLRMELQSELASFQKFQEFHWKCRKTKSKQMSFHQASILDNNDQVLLHHLPSLPNKFDSWNGLYFPNSPSLWKCLPQLTE